MTEGLDRFTERAHRSLLFAEEEVRRFGHDYVGTEHMLLGLLCVSDSQASHTLNSMGIDVDRVRAVISLVIGEGERTHTDQISLTPRSKRVIEHAVEEAQRLNHPYLDTEHLLLGLLREDQAVAATLIETLGVSLEQVRAATLEAMRAAQSDPGHHVGGPP
jgi:ATP-dependent Clp protease ATP-binding subunit ClpC